MSFFVMRSPLCDRFLGARVYAQRREPTALATADLGPATRGRQKGDELLLIGSATLAESLIELDLIDESG
jgi:hypothetical protein